VSLAWILCLWCRRVLPRRLSLINRFLCLPATIAVAFLTFLSLAVGAAVKVAVLWLVK